jgi:hypothetical protein
MIDKFTEICSINQDCYAFGSREGQSLRAQTGRQWEKVRKTEEGGNGSPWGLALERFSNRAFCVERI